MSLVISLFCNMFRCLIRAATILNKCFKRDIGQRTFSADLMRSYRILWLRWSQLVSHMGYMMGKVFCLYLVLLLLAITMSLYGFLSQMDEKQITFAHTGLGVFSLFCIAALYHFCNLAYYSSNIVGVEIRDELQLIAPSEVTKDVFHEVNMFLDTISMNPPVVSVAGFANVDRGLFRAYASTIVTFMIVLLQFDQSGHAAISCRGNETKVLNAW
ncbi:gustatory and odorant receptor 22-like [Zootermopsis nevadensis]|nr:gustatory and odorant receptor 22-like [Zootermopsis nevadensis]